MIKRAQIKRLRQALTELANSPSNDPAYCWYCESPKGDCDRFCPVRKAKIVLKETAP